MINAQWVETPKYVLLDCSQRIGPKLLALHTGPKCLAVYGFSGKQAYEAFCANSQLALTPYPLVMGYLRNQLALPGNAIHLVVIDATGPNDSHPNAANMNSVLEAQEKRSSQVNVSFRLTRDEPSQAYRIENVSPSVDNQTECCD